MRGSQNAPQSGRIPSPVETTDANRLRDLLQLANLSQRAAARLLEVDERTMRQWCAGQGKPPASVFRALDPRMTWAESVRQLIESNDKVIEAMRDGRIIGVGYGSGPSDPMSIAQEIERLRKLNEQHRSLLRLDEAQRRKQEAYFSLMVQWLPHGSGVPSEECTAEADSADAEYRAAQAEVDRITMEIRAGQR